MNPQVMAILKQLYDQQQNIPENEDWTQRLSRKSQIHPTPRMDQYPESPLTPKVSEEFTGFNYPGEMRRPDIPMPQPPQNPPSMMMPPATQSEPQQEEQQDVNFPDLSGFAPGTNDVPKGTQQAPDIESLLRMLQMGQ